MRPLTLALLTALAACEPTEPRAGGMPPRDPPPKPEPVEEPKPVEPVAEATGTDEASKDPEATSAPPAADPAAAEMSDEELLAAAMGLPPPPKEDPPVPAAVGAGAPGAAPWTPAAPAASWGVRVVSIVANAQPPRAILGLGDGREVVVEPGTFVPEEHVVVMAIGAEAVQVAVVEPAGDRARVQTQTLTPLYRAPSAP